MTFPSFEKLFSIADVRNLRLCVAVGHAGAVISGGKGKAEDKVAALEKAGVIMVDSPAKLGASLKDVSNPRSSHCFLPLFHGIVTDSPGNLCLFFFFFARTSGYGQGRPRLKWGFRRQAQ